MADKKISQLTTLIQANVDVTADFVPIVDTGAVETKKVTPQALVQAGATGATFALADGAVGTPSLTNTGDENTGLWFPAADTIAVSTGGSERLRLDSSGNLGIGTASPVYRIDALLGAGSGNIARFGQSGVSNGYVITTNGSALTHEWANGGSVSMAFTSSGNLGIGTASPEQKLHVAGGGNTYLATQRTAASTSALIMGSESGKNSIYSWTTPTGATGVPLGITIGGTEVVNLDVSANATIGGGALATNATNGFLYVPTCAGTPTGTPTAKTGYAPIVVNTTNNKLYFYSGGAWRDAGP